MGLLSFCNYRCNCSLQVTQRPSGRWASWAVLLPGAMAATECHEIVEACKTANAFSGGPKSADLCSTQVQASKQPRKGRVRPGRGGNLFEACSWAYQFSRGRQLLYLFAARQNKKSRLAWHRTVSAAANHQGLKLRSAMHTEQKGPMPCRSAYGQLGLHYWRPCKQLQRQYYLGGDGAQEVWGRGGASVALEQPEQLEDPVPSSGQETVSWGQHLRLAGRIAQT